MYIYTAETYRQNTLGRNHMKQMMKDDHARNATLFCLWGTLLRATMSSLLNLHSIVHELCVLIHFDQDQSKPVYHLRRGL